MPSIIQLNETKSTNLHLQELLHTVSLEEGSIVTASYQTAGKGQANNTWEAERDKNILCSMVLYPDFIDVTEQFIISELVSIAVVDTLSKYTSDIQIKWPNDIYHHEKKIAGILIENNLCGQCIESSVIGMGINVNQTTFHSEAPNPISLKQITGKDYDLNTLIRELVSTIFFRYNQLMSGGEKELQEEYFKQLFRNKGFHSYRSNKGTFKARIKTIQPSGHLVLQTETGTEYYFAFKEVEFVL